MAHAGLKSNFQRQTGHATTAARYVWVGAAVGCALALTALSPAFISGAGRWLRPENDLNAYLVAWHYYIVDGWRFPLFNIPAMGYPEGGSVLFNDALPLTALPTKILFKLTGVAVNPFGWWIFLTYVLQGAMAARLVCALGARSMWAAAAAATLAVCCLPFTYRWGHTALSAHFLVIWALALYFESTDRGRVKALEIGCLAVLTILVNSYLFVMVMIICGATIVEHWRRGQLAWADVGTLAVWGAITVVVALAAGYGVLFTNPSSMKSGGFGFFSWNPLSVAVPPPYFWGVPRGIVRDATGGQYEGDSYIGLGALLLLIGSLAVRPGAPVRALRRHPVLAATLGALALWAASNRLYVGSRLLVAVNLSARLTDLANYFRASGRFIWPVAYMAMLAPVAVIARWERRKVGAAVVILAAMLQAVELRPTLRDLRSGTAIPVADVIDAGRMSGWIRSHDRVWQYPSWACGSLMGTQPVWGGPEANRELQVELLTARLGVPSNSVYTSRVMKDCGAEAAWGGDPGFEKGVLYLLAPATVKASPALSALVAKSSCRDLSWVIVCSKDRFDVR
jgi:hypothetical protein